MAGNTQDNSGELIKAGQWFTVMAHRDVDLTELRQHFKQETGFSPHIHAAIGPLEVLASDEEEGVKMSCPVVSVDDLYLEFSLSNFPLPDQSHVLYVGYLTEPAEAEKG